MNFSDHQSPLTQIDLTKDKMDRWVEATTRGEKTDIDVYGKPTKKQLQELENVRNLSKELQENLHEIENAVRIPEIENEALTPTAPILEYSDDHEFISNQKEGYYAEEDLVDAKEEEKRRLMKGNAPRTEIQRFYKDQCVFLTGGTGFLGKDGRISLKASRVIEKVVL